MQSLSVEVDKSTQPSTSVPVRDHRHQPLPLVTNTANVGTPGRRAEVRVARGWRPTSMKATALSRQRIVRDQDDRQPSDCICLKVDTLLLRMPAPTRAFLHGEVEAQPTANTSNASPAYRASSRSRNSIGQPASAASMITQRRQPARKTRTRPTLVVTSVLVGSTPY